MKVPSRAVILELVGAIFDAAGDPRQWPHFLAKYSNAIGGRESFLQIHDLRNKEGCIAFQVNVDPVYEREYNEHYFSRNEWLNRGAHLFQLGSVVLGQAVILDRQLRKTEFYNDYLRRAGMEHSIGGIVAREGTVIAAIGTMRPPGPPFDHEEAETLKVLMPHLECAVQLHHRIAGLETRLTAANDALYHLPVGFILVGTSGKVLSFNRLAEAILSKRDGLTIGSHGLLASRSDETADLRNLIGGAIATAKGKGIDSGEFMSLSRPSLRRPLSILVTPLRASTLVLGIDTPAASIFVSDPEMTVQSKDQVLRRLFGLTQAESKLAAVLMQGRSLDEASNFM